MKAVLQRVSQATVTVDGKVVGACRNPASGNTTGLMILLGVQESDSETQSSYLAKKATELRIFADDEGKMNKSVIEVGGAALVVSQFTLLADWRKGRRPGFTQAAKPAEGERLYLHFVDQLKLLGLPVQTGIFGADMEISLTNDGPVTLLLDTNEL